MTNGVNDDLGFGSLVENEMRIRQCRHAPDGRVVRAGADARMQQQKIDDRLNAGLHAAGTLRGTSRDVTEDRVEVGKSREGVAKPSQAVFGPDSPHLFLGRELTAGSR
jgi:hypothetical protein